MSAQPVTIPPMAPEIATGIRHMMVGSIQSEIPTTSKVILAITRPDFKLDDKARSAIELAQHIVSVEVQFMHEIAEGAFKMEPRYPNLPQDTQSLVKWYESEMPKAIEAVNKMTPQQLVKQLDFYGAFNFPAVCYLDFVSKHSIHHRGQLAASLRPMGSKCPSIYGGSADEPWEG